MPELHLAVIIPSTLNAPQLSYLQRAISSITLAQKGNRSVVTTVCVVSSQRPSRRLKEKHPEVFFIKAPRGAGFAELNNVALEFLRTFFSVKAARHPDFLLLLNDDARLQPDFYIELQRIEASATKRRNRADIYAPLIFDANHPTMIDSFGVEYFRSGYAKNCRNKKVATTLTTAGCEVIRWTFVQKFLSAYGFFFNPLYFYYLEDVDFSIRALMIGAKIERASTLKALHHGSITSGGKQNTFSLRFTYRNILWVILCCWPAGMILRNLPNILFVQAWVMIYSTIRCGLLCYPNLLFQTVLFLPELLQARRKIVTAYTAHDFEALLSPFSFRTFHDKTVPAL